MNRGVKTFRIQRSLVPQFSAEFWHSVLSGGTQNRVFSRRQSEETKVLNISFNRMRIKSTTIAFTGATATRQPQGYSLNSQASLRKHSCLYGYNIFIYLEYVVACDCRRDSCGFDSNSSN